MSWLNGRVILVTGGASGLGRRSPFNRPSSAPGWRSSTCMRSDWRLPVRMSRRSRATASRCAATSPMRIRSSTAIQQTVSKFGQLDTVVNSAGVYWKGPLIDTPIKEFDRVFNVNVRGLYLVCREAAKVMLPRKSGHLINIASIAAERGISTSRCTRPANGRCAASGPVWRWSSGPTGIRVSTIFPGGMDTNFWENDPRKLSGAVEPDPHAAGQRGGDGGRADRDPATQRGHQRGAGLPPRHARGQRRGVSTGPGLRSAAP